MRFRERLAIAIAWRLPKRVVMWAALRLVAHATMGPWSTQEVSELTAMDALKRWPVQ
jgi:hypothetical protein